MELNEYLRQEAKFECLKINMAMDKSGQTYQEVLVDLLKERKATEKVINKYIKDSKKVTIPFSHILQAIKSREGRSWHENKKQESLHKMSVQKDESPPSSYPVSPIPKSNKKLSVDSEIQRRSS